MNEQNSAATPFFPGRERGPDVHSVNVTGRLSKHGSLASRRTLSADKTTGPSLPSQFPMPSERTRRHKRSGLHTLVACRGRARAAPPSRREQRRGAHINEGDSRGRSIASLVEWVALSSNTSRGASTGAVSARPISPTWTSSSPRYSPNLFQLGSAPGRLIPAAACLSSRALRTSPHALGSSGFPSFLRTKVGECVDASSAAPPPAVLPLT